MAFFDTGAKIREVRKARNLNQDQLAELSSLNRVTIAKYESGKVEPGAQALARIADALDVSTDVLLGRAENTPEPADRPRTVEARIISGGVDRLPKDKREMILAVVRAVCVNHPELFEEGSVDGSEF